MLVAILQLGKDVLYSLLLLANYGNGSHIYFFWFPLPNEFSKKKNCRGVENFLGMQDEEMEVKGKRVKALSLQEPGSGQIQYTPWRNFAPFTTSTFIDIHASAQAWENAGDRQWVRDT